MAPFATSAQLSNWMGRLDGFTAEETARADLLLDMATELVREEAGQPITQTVGDNATLDGTGTHELVLPHWPVTAVTSVTVTEAGEDPVVLVEGDDFRFQESGVVLRIDDVWPARDDPRSVSVVYTSGFATLSKDLVGVVLRLASRSWENPGGAVSEELGDRNVRWAAAGMELTAAERRIVGRYQART